MPTAIWSSQFGSGGTRATNEPECSLLCFFTINLPHCCQSWLFFVQIWHFNMLGLFEPWSTLICRFVFVCFGLPPLVELEASVLKIFKCPQGLSLRNALLATLEAMAENISRRLTTAPILFCAAPNMPFFLFFVQWCSRYSLVPILLT